MQKLIGRDTDARAKNENTKLMPKAFEEHEATTTYAIFL